LFEGARLSHERKTLGLVPYAQHTKKVTRGKRKSNKPICVWDERAQTKDPGAPGNIFNDLGKPGTEAIAIKRGNRGRGIYRTG